MSPEVIGTALKLAENGWAVVVLFVLLMMTGVLRTRVEVKEARQDRAARLADRDQRIVELRDQATGWQSALADSERARADQAMVLERLVETLEAQASPIRRGITDAPTPEGSSAGSGLDRGAGTAAGAGGPAAFGRHYRRTPGELGGGGQQGTDGGVAAPA